MLVLGHPEQKSEFSNIQVSQFKAIDVFIVYPNTYRHTLSNCWKKLSPTSDLFCQKKVMLGPRGELGILTTPYNVGSVLWRLFSTLEVVQYIGGITSVLWGDSFSTVEVVHSFIASVLWRWFSTVGG